MSCSPLAEMIAGLTWRVRLISILVLCLDLVGRNFTDTMFTKRLWHLSPGRNQPSAVTMHFVDPIYDRGPIFFALPIPIEPNDTPETLAARVNRAEHEWQPRGLNYVMHGQVRLVGKEVVYETEELKRLDARSVGSWMALLFLLSRMEPSPDRSYSIRPTA